MKNILGNFMSNRFGLKPLVRPLGLTVWVFKNFARLTSLLRFVAPVTSTRL